MSYNSAKALQKFWGNVTLTDDVEWIVVDNASSDDSAKIARDLGARVIELSDNIGFGAANNLGFQHSGGDLVAFINPDVTPRITDLTELASHLVEHPRDLVAPQLLNPDRTEQPNGRGLPYLAYKILNRTDPQRLQNRYLLIAKENEKRTCDWVMGAVVGATRERFLKLGPWDEKFFVYYEDSDIGLRNAQQGGRSVVIGSVRWIHGWARETKTASLSAWKREIPSLVKFYLRYPKLLLIPPTFAPNQEAK
ncbi:glycosyltransferase [Microbacterium keratanolyticum]